jgi:hypothetical protein
MFSSKFLYFILFLIFIDANAQNNEPINSDRPDQSEGTYILTKNSFQIENGLLLQDKEMLEDYLVTVLNKAITKATNVNEAEMAAVAQSGMPSIPGMDMFK